MSLPCKTGESRINAICAIIEIAIFETDLAEYQTDFATGELKLVPSDALSRVRIDEIGGILL